MDAQNPREVQPRGLDPTQEEAHTIRKLYQIEGNPERAGSNNTEGGAHFKANGTQESGESSGEALLHQDETRGDRPIAEN